MLKHLRKIESSTTFSTVLHQKELLRLVVEETLAGRQDQLNAASIAAELFRNDDVAMRQTAKKLRDRLREYYDSEGRSERVRIEIPKGRYVPKFSTVASPAAPTAPDETGLHAGASIASQQAGCEPQPWNIPPRNPFFTGRDAYLEALRDVLIRNSAAAVCQPQAIKGLGGIGKTETAIEYAHRYRGHYTAAFWVLADSRDSLLSGYASLARLLGLSGTEQGDASLIAESTRFWLQSHDGWLLILDNVDDLRVIRPFLPDGRGHCLITTRLHATGGVAESLELESLTGAEAALFLLRRARVIPRDAAIEVASEAERALAAQLVDEVGGLALALDQAGAFIEEIPSTLDEYLRLYRSEGRTLRAERGYSSPDHPPVTVTFSLAFANIEAENPEAADLLRAIAFLGPDVIPEELLTGGAAQLGPHLHRLTWQPWLFTLALKEAGRFSLIRRNPDNRSIYIHRLVQTVIRDAMDEASSRNWVLRLAQALAVVMPVPVFSNWQVFDRYVPHVRAIAQSTKAYGIEDAAVGCILSRCGSYLCQRAEYEDSEALIIQGLAIREKLLGPEHSDTAASLSDLGDLHSAKGRYRDAEPFYERALAIRERILGAEHLDTAASLGALADNYRFQALSRPKDWLVPGEPPPDIAKAEPLYRRSLTLREKILGAEHIDTASTLYGLADTYRYQERFTEAEPLYQRVLVIREHLLGAEHPQTAEALTGLALLNQSRGLLVEAESLFRRSAELIEKAYGSEHPAFADALMNYALLIWDLDRKEEAATLYGRARKIRAKFINQKSLQEIIGLLEGSCLDSEAKAWLHANLLYRGLDDRTRNQIRFYCEHGIRKIDEEIAAIDAYLSLSNLDGKPVPEGNESQSRGDGVDTP